jgi:hypothetical protein
VPNLGHKSFSTIGSGRVETRPEGIPMFAQALARRLARPGVHYGWAIVAIVFVRALTTAGWGVEARA